MLNSLVVKHPTTDIAAADERDLGLVDLDRGRRLVLGDRECSIDPPHVRSPYATLPRQHYLGEALPKHQRDPRKSAARNPKGIAVRIMTGSIQLSYCERAKINHTQSGNTP